MSMKITCLENLTDLQKCSYSIVGDGQYVVDLMLIIQAENLSLPEYIFVRDNVPSLPEELQRPEKDISLLKEGVLLLGSSAFQMEIVERIKKFNSSGLDYCTLLDNRQYESHPANFSRDYEPKDNYLLFISNNPIRHHDLFTHQFFRKLGEENVHTIVKHPLQNMSDGLIKGALGIVVWNGSMSVHKPFIQRCRRLNVKLTFGECGFFPQSDFFYFDKSGINHQSQLKGDSLNWVNSSHIEQLERVRQRFFHNVPQHTDSDYIFVPLQVPNDSNILLNSRFAKGMQEFIDFIEEKYSDEKVLFKAHPKDRMKGSYILKNGAFSDADSRTLIKSAKLVHGINSSVLFEAALAKKNVIAEGECLLNDFSTVKDKLLAAMIERQFSVHESCFDFERVRKFTHFSEQLISRLAA